MAAEEMGRVSATPTMHRDEDAHEERSCCSVAHMMRVPTWLAAVPMGAAISMERPTPAKMVTSGVTRMSILVSLLTALPSSAATMAMMSTASGPPAPPRRVGGVAHGDQAEQHQRRAVQRPADGHGHGRAAHGRGVAAQVHQHVQAESAGPVF